MNIGLRVAGCGLRGSDGGREYDLLGPPSILGKRFQLRKVALPSCIHRTRRRRLDFYTSPQPIGDPRGVVIVVPRQDLGMTTLAEPRQTLPRLTMIPIHNGHSGGQAFP